MSSSTCCFLTCIQISQEAGRVVWYSHLFKNFPQFVVIRTIKGFVIVNKLEVGVFLEHSCFFDDPTDVGNLISGSSAFSESILHIWKFVVIPSNYSCNWGRHRYLTSFVIWKSLYLRTLLTLGTVTKDVDSCSLALFIYISILKLEWKELVVNVFFFSRILVVFLLCLHLKYFEF